MPCLFVAYGLLAKDVKLLRHSPGVPPPGELRHRVGIVVAEALACGTPVLISDQVNILREILDSNVGWVELDTLEGTARLLRRWLEMSVAQREAMAATAEATFQQRFSLRRSAESIHALAKSFKPPITCLR